MPAPQCPVCSIVPLDWTRARVAVDNLANSNAGNPAELRYVRAGSFEGRDLDLIITLTANASSSCGDGSVGTQDACR